MIAKEIGPPPWPRYDREIGEQSHSYRLSAIPGLSISTLLDDALLGQHKAPSKALTRPIVNNGIVKIATSSAARRLPS